MIDADGCCSVGVRPEARAMRSNYIALMPFLCMRVVCRIFANKNSH